MMPSFDSIDDIKGNLTHPKLEVEINGEIVEYDLCAGVFEAYLKIQHTLTYLGESKIWYWNGVRQESKTPTHYWKYNNEI